MIFYKPYWRLAMDNKRISKFQWAMMIFVFIVIAQLLLPIILKDLQGSTPFKTFVFDLSYLAPFVAAIFCILVFKHRDLQLQGLKFTIDLKVVERILLALILPIIILIICMTAFNTYAASFILLQPNDLSVSISSIIIGQIVMAFIVEFGFRSYLQQIIEMKMNTFFASIVVGVLFAIWNINMSFSMEYTMYNVLYSFTFSLLVGELIRNTEGRTIYIATIFHAAMSIPLVFLFNEELGNVFAMKVIALATTGVTVVYIALSLIIRLIIYLTTKRSLDEVEENNYLDHVNDRSDNESTLESDNDDALNATSTYATTEAQNTSQETDATPTNEATNETPNSSRDQNEQSTETESNETVDTDHTETESTVQSTTDQTETDVPNEAETQPTDVTDNETTEETVTDNDDDNDAIQSEINAAHRHSHRR